MTQATANNPADSVFWFNQTAHERVETARRVSNRLRFIGRLEDHLNTTYLKPLEEVVRRDGLMLVEFTPGGLRLSSGLMREEMVTEFRFIAEPGETSDIIEVQLLRIRGTGSDVCASWHLVKGGHKDDNWSMLDLPQHVGSQMARAAGTVVADATYRQHDAVVEAE